jgi:SPP1 gp7 family putative phage head morphogenesis protein
MLDPLLSVFKGQIQANVTGRLVLAYLRGSAQMVEWGRTVTTDRPIFFEGPPMQQAIDYANKHCAQLVTRMDQETKNRLAQVVADAIERKAGVDGLARDIRREFSAMTRDRSELIARTETADALEQSFMDRSKDLGVTGKEWVVASDPCDICRENGDAGAIGINEEFPSGDQRPPAHPACVCALAPVMLS